MFNFCKTNFKEKRAMILWRKAYQARLLARKKVFEHKYKKAQYSATDYAGYLFEQDKLALRNQYLNFLVQDLCKELSRYINEHPEEIKKRVIKHYGLEYKFTPEQLQQINYNIL